jgi:hypothetical protein
MKIKVYSIFFLAVLALYILRPVIPFIEYAVNKDYIAKNLCINRDKPKSCCEGKCHLKKELSKSDTSSETTKDSTKKPQQKQINEFLKAQIRSCQSFETFVIQYFIVVSGKEKDITSSIFVPPPYTC